MAGTAGDIRPFQVISIVFRMGGVALKRSCPFAQFARLIFIPCIMAMAGLTTSASTTAMRELVGVGMTCNTILAGIVGIWVRIVAIVSMMAGISMTYLTDTIIDGVTVSIRISSFRVTGGLLTEITGELNSLDTTVRCRQVTIYEPQISVIAAIPSTIHVVAHSTTINMVIFCQSPTASYENKHRGKKRCNYYVFHSTFHLLLPLSKLRKDRGCAAPKIYGL
jgi:hypothetical protein